jgi:hypothetical protein
MPENQGRKYTESYTKEGICLKLKKHQIQRRELRYQARPVTRGDQHRAHELGEIRGPHLDHDIGSVDLDRSRANSEVMSNCLVGLASNKAIQDPPFTGGERDQSFADFGFFTV